MGRIQGLSEGYYTADTLVKTGHGYVFSVVISFRGSGVGGYVVLRDGLTNSGSVLAVFSTSAASNTIAHEFKQGKEYNTGLFVDFQAGGQVDVCLTYK